MAETEGHSFDVAFDPGRAYSQAWRGFKLNPMPLFVGGLLMQCTQGGSGGGNIGRLGDLIPQEESSYDNSSGGDFDWGERLFWRIQDGLPDFERMIENMGGDGFSMGVIIGLVFAAVVCGLIIGLALAAVNAFLQVGWLRMHQEVLSNGTTDLGRMFSGADRFMPLFLWKLLSGVIQFGLTLLMSLPGGAVLALGAYQENIMLVVAGGALIVLLALPVSIYVALGLSFGAHAVVFEGCAPMQALERTWSVSDGNRVALFVFQLVGAVVGIVGAVLGLCMCLIGLVVTLPIVRAVVDLAFTNSWLMHTRPVAETDAWKLPDMA